MLPRVVIAGTTSGAGKTTVATGLIAALRQRGDVVQGFKVGPDFIDPSYHAAASGRPGRNLDAFLCGPELIAPLARHGGAGADLAIVEGMMGMFDGVSGDEDTASTAHVARLLRAPVLLVVDAGAMARSAAAVVHGFATLDPDVHVAGVIFNRVGSPGHAQLLRDAVATLPGRPVPVIGTLPHDERLRTPERHLGLVPAVERAAHTQALIDAASVAITAGIDLEAVTRIAQSALPLPGLAWSALGAPEGAPKAVIAVAGGRAFSFHYQENLELLAAAGAELAVFDPTVDDALPPGTQALLLAGGFPERYADDLAANTELRAQIGRFAGSGGPILAECGGLLYLARSLDGREMCGVVPVDGRMTSRPVIGFRTATASTAVPWLDAGTRMRAHEFHFSSIDPIDEVAAPAWTFDHGDRTVRDGVVAGATQAGYLHTHWAAYPEIARRFVDCAAR